MPVVIPPSRLCYIIPKLEPTYELPTAMPPVTEVICPLPVVKYGISFEFLTPEPPPIVRCLLAPRTIPGDRG